MPAFTATPTTAKISSSTDHHHPQQQQRPIYQQNEFLRQDILGSPMFAEMRTLLFILKATGLLPIFEQISNYKIGPPTKSNQYYSFFIRVVVHTLTVFAIYNLFTPGSSQLFLSYRDTDNINQWIELLLCIFTFSVTVFICARNAQVFVKLINEILKVDEDINRQFGATLKNNCNFSAKFIFGIFVCQIYILVLKKLGINVPLTVTSYVLIGFYGLQNGLSTIFIVYAAALLRIITIRFEYLNMVLNGYSYVQQRKQQRRAVRRINDITTGMMENFPEDSLFTFRVHNRLLRIYKTINDCCSLILVGYMGYAFYTITTTTYNMFVQITTQTDLSPIVMQLCFAWLCLHTALLALLSKSCGNATKEVGDRFKISICINKIRLIIIVIRGYQERKNFKIYLLFKIL